MTTILQQNLGIIRTEPSDGPPKLHGICDVCGDIEPLGRTAPERWSQDPVCDGCRDAMPHHVPRRDAYGARID